MFNILIISNKLKFIKRLTNNVFNHLKFVKILGIISSFNELDSIFSIESLNTIILPDSVYKKIVDKKITNICNSFIIISDLKPHIPTEKPNITYISESMSDTKLFSIIEVFIKDKSEEYLKEFISKILIDLKFNLSLIGTKFLIEAIYYSFINRDLYLMENLENNVYPFIAEKYMTDTKSVKWSIIRSINYMFLSYNTNSAKYLSDYFYIDYLKKPTPKIVITTLVDKLY